MLVIIGVGVNFFDVVISGNFIDLILGVFNIEDYGVVVDDLIDNKVVIDVVIVDIIVNGGGILLIFLSGVFCISGLYDFLSNMMVKGYGLNLILKRFLNVYNCIFEYILLNRLDIDRENFFFDGVRIEGMFDEIGEENDGVIIVVVGFRNVNIINCMFYYCEFFCLNMN